MKFQFTFSVLFILLFSGCSQGVSKHISRDKVLTQSIKYTQVAKLYNSENEISLLLNISYLNKLDPEIRENRDFFLVGIYKDDEINPSTLELSINNRKAVVHEDHEQMKSLLKHIALKNNWAKYQIYSIKHKETSQFNIKIATKSSQAQISISVN
jgi:hypothetical protein